MQCLRFRGESKKEFRGFTSSKMFFSKETYHLWQYTSQTYLPVKTYFAELMLGGINVMVVKHLSIGETYSCG